MSAPNKERTLTTPLAPSSAPGEKLLAADHTVKSVNLTSGTLVAGKFALIREIGAGAMGTVFEAHDTLVDRVVALKLMHPFLHSRPDGIARFTREARAAARIRHPNVVALFEMGKRRDGTFYIVQEMLDGRTLQDYLSQCGKLSAADTLSIALPVMGGLAAAHASGIVHRDVKPDNIVLSHTPSGERVPKLIDFGIAKFSTDIIKQNITHIGTLIGTPHYMSPEQASGRHVDARTDIWTMGVLLFEMLTGTHPFNGETHEAVLEQIRSQEPLKIEDVLPSAAAFSPVIARALQRPCDARFENMHQMREALEAVQLALAVPIVSADAATQPAMTLPLAVNEVVQEIVLDDADLEIVPAEADPPTLRASMRPSSPSFGEPITSSSWSKATAEWNLGQRPLDSVVIGSHLDMAEHALSINALPSAVASTEFGLKQAGLPQERRGKLCLVQSIAQRWLGQHAASAQAADESMRHLAVGSTGWHAAFGHFVIAQSQLGSRSHIDQCMHELKTLESNGEIMSEAHLVSACRLSVCALRLGRFHEARSLYDNAHSNASGRSDLHPFVHAWLSVARAELFMHRGDLTAHLRHVYAAAERFMSAGDIRNATLQRSNIGNALLQLGGFEQACSIFDETIRIAEPMRLDFVTLTRANLAMTLANLGQLDAARNTAETALIRAREQGNRRCESVALVYLARIRAMTNDVAGALAAAMDAKTAARDIPAVRAFALAIAASLLYRQSKFLHAEKLAASAMQIVEQLQGIEEGESLIRMTYTLVLLARGNENDGKRILEHARRSLLDRAECIGEAGWRSSFLMNVPDNRELLQLAEKWLGPYRPTSA